MAAELLLGKDGGLLVLDPSEFSAASGEILHSEAMLMSSQCFFYEDDVPSGLYISKISMDEEARLNPARESCSVTLSWKVLLLTLNQKKKIKNHTYVLQRIF